MDRVVLFFRLFEWNHLFFFKNIILLVILLIILRFFWHEYDSITIKAHLYFVLIILAFATWNNRVLIWHPFAALCRPICHVFILIFFHVSD